MDLGWTSSGADETWESDTIRCKRTPWREAAVKYVGLHWSPNARYSARTGGGPNRTIRSGACTHSQCCTHYYSWRNQGNDAGLYALLYRWSQKCTWMYHHGRNSWPPTRNPAKTWQLHLVHLTLLCVCIRATRRAFSIYLHQDRIQATRRFYIADDRSQ
jgi:hypothetical protein